MTRMTSSMSPGRARVVTYVASASSRPSPTCQLVTRCLAPKIMRNTDHRRNGIRLPPISDRRFMRSRRSSRGWHVGRDVVLRAAFADRIEPPRALVDRCAFPLLEICLVDLALGERSSDGELVGVTQTRQVERSELHDDV